MRFPGTMFWRLEIRLKIAYDYINQIRTQGLIVNGIIRNAAQKIKDLVLKFPVVAILGARQVGKTTLSRDLFPEWKYIDLEKPTDIERIQYDPLFFFEQNPQHVIIDEAQTYPDLFSVLRGVIDNHRTQKGRFILTGSSSPELMTHISESLAGRIAIVELGSLKANEFFRKPLSPLYQLFQQELDRRDLVEGKPPLSTEEIQHAWLFGGYPEPTLASNELYFHQWMENYQATYINRDIAALFPRLNRNTFRRFIGILGQLSGSIINRSDLGRALEVSEKSVRDYLHIAEGTFMWRSIPSFEKNIVKSVIKMPKGYIRDSGLLHEMTGIYGLEQLYSHPMVGRSFESYVMEEIIKGLESTNATGWQSYYYRTRNGAEIDLILDGPFGTCPIEIKYGSHTPLKQLVSLNQFVEEHQLPFGILINQGNQVEWLTKNIIQIPAGFI